MGARVSAPEDGSARTGARCHKQGPRRPHVGSPPSLTYEHRTGGRVRFVRLNVTVPAGEVNVAVVLVVSTSVPSWNGLPQPGGGFPLPSDKGCAARQNVPSILAH